ncbi:MAG: hypothetical protein ACXAC5_02455 [Promethearchaeota archaeon]|jgi:hypothetical protein
MGHERCFECGKKKEKLSDCPYCEAGICKDCRDEHFSDCALANGPDIFSMVRYDGKELCLGCFLDNGGTIRDDGLEILNIGSWNPEGIPKCSLCLKEHPEYINSDGRSHQTC